MAEEAAQALALLAAAPSASTRHTDGAPIGSAIAGGGCPVGFAGGTPPPGAHAGACRGAPEHVTGAAGACAFAAHAEQDIASFSRGAARSSATPAVGEPDAGTESRGGGSRGAGGGADSESKLWWECCHPKCTRLFSHYDGARKHARLKHPQWVRRRMMARAPAVPRRLCSAGGAFAAEASATHGGPAGRARARMAARLAGRPVHVFVPNATVRCAPACAFRALLRSRSPALPPPPPPPPPPPLILP